jgi:hypothetical protein
LNRGVVTIDRVLAPAGASKVTEHEATGWSVGDGLLMIFAGFIALVLSVSGLALLVVASRAFFQ